jgi:hypothetical protein
VQDRLIFVIGPPRSGSTLLTRMLGAHSAVHSPVEPHLLTPLAHLGYYAKVERADYDPIIAQRGIRAVVESLPQGESQYLDALRAYTDAVYRGLLESSGRKRLLDKTPAYGLVLDFVEKLYPRARYVVLTRNPLAVWSSYVNSFFDGDHAVAHAHNPLLERYVPAMARFLRETRVQHCHVRYEELVQSPREEMQRLCEFLDLPFEEDMIEYGRSEGGQVESARGLGDPVTIAKESRPTTASVARWVEDYAGQAEGLALAQQILAKLTDEDLGTWGFSRNEIEADLARVDTAAPAQRTRPFSRYAFERWLVVRLRRNIHHNALGKLVRKLREACDVLLR